ncbi:MAG: hypothetical protein BEN19_01825 [Epulopiscium sp. Nuni2H_MBin003]|nr:MAG: hypothetical protein BEN19_01825 [Epulopiscium sp. Nuni2H_MBin003]
MNKQEQKFLRKVATKKPSKLEELIANKVPDKLQETLQVAFAKSFAIVFEKGTSVIEKSYNKEEIEHQHKVNAYSFSIKPDKKRIKAFEREVNKSENLNVLISGAKGVGLGFLGVGLPDIPVFIAMVLKGIYQISMQYGYDYTKEEEKYFILKLISTALSHGEDAVIGNECINNFMKNNILPSEHDFKIQIDEVSEILSTELLYMKFVQGLPVVGVVGGLSDAVFVKKILSYAKLKYKQRFFEVQDWKY